MLLFLFVAVAYFSLIFWIIEYGDRWRAAKIPSTPRIENWRIAFGDQIVGQVYGDPRFEDGEIIVTSSVVRWDHTTGKVYTKNSGYELGKRGND